MQPKGIFHQKKKTPKVQTEITKKAENWNKIRTTSDKLQYLEPFKIQKKNKFSSIKFETRISYGCEKPYLHVEGRLVELLSPGDTRLLRRLVDRQRDARCCVHDIVAAAP